MPPSNTDSGSGSGLQNHAVNVSFWCLTGSAPLRLDHTDFRPFLGYASPAGRRSLISPYVIVVLLSRLLFLYIFWVQISMDSCRIFFSQLISQKFWWYHWLSYLKRNEEKLRSDFMLRVILVLPWNLLFNPCPLYNQLILVRLK